MPARRVAARELANLFGVLSNPDRIRIVEELRHGEKDVGTLQALVGISRPRVSQHLSLMRAHRLVEERRDGRHVYYHLCVGRLAGWVLDGLDFVEIELKGGLRETLVEAARQWREEGSERPT